MSQKAKSPNKPETNPTVLHEAMVRRIARHHAGKGRITMKCVPALCDHYVEMLGTLFKLHGRPYNAGELDSLRTILRNQLELGYKASPYSRIIVDWNTDDPPKTGLSYFISHRVFSIPELYKEWVDTRTPPLFGPHPDAKVMDLAKSLGPAAEVPIIDIGAGTGRNTLALARAGHPATAVEMSPALVDVLKKDAEAQNVKVDVIQGDALDESVILPAGTMKLAILCEVVSHFRGTPELRALFRRLGDVLQPGGMLLFSAFVCHDSYTPDKLAREMAEAYWCSFFTRKEIGAAADGFPFALISDESTHDYEKEHLPAEAWPPTGWFVGWSQGRDVFHLVHGKPPAELRWVAYQRV
jgi:SAM-dependent methyltransferase